MSISIESLWEIYVKKNSHWETENVTLTPAGLKKLVENTYQQGLLHGIMVQQKHDELDSDEEMDYNYTKPMYSNHKSGTPDVKDLFGGVFKDIFK